MTERGVRTWRPIGWPASWPTWWPAMALITVTGLAIRIASVLGRPGRPAGGDPYYYHNAANLLASGKGFINPFLYYGAHRVVPTASFPPGFVVVLALASVVGLKSYFAHRIWCCVIGAGAIVVAGLAGREIAGGPGRPIAGQQIAGGPGGPTAAQQIGQIAGHRVGLITAALVALDPNVWMNDEIGLSETLSPLLVALILLAAYRFWSRPGWRTAIWLGASIGGAALARDELATLGLFVAVPLALLVRQVGWRRRAALLAVAAVTALAVIGPWVGYNMSRFRDPVFISSGLGVTLASTNCPRTYAGNLDGYWNQACALAAPIDPNVDESVQGAQAQSYALHFIRTHESRLVPVGAARLGRAFGLFHPMQQIMLDSRVETRPYHWALAGLVMYYAMAVLAVPGAVILRRRGVPVFPLLAVGATVAVSVLLTFGDTRYRTTFEVSLAVLASLLLARLIARDRSPAPPAEEERQRAAGDHEGRSEEQHHVEARGERALRGG